MAAKTTRRRRSRRKVGSVDKASADYARLLLDPCNAPLVHAPGNNSGGFVVRLESDFLFSNGTGETAFFLRWAPGNLCAGSVDAGLAWSAGVDDITPLSAGGAFASNLMPGYTYLTTNARAVRCLAACAQVYWPGSELNRQGVISGAVAPAEAIKIGTSYRVSAVRAASPYVTRVPQDHMEIKWSPGNADSLYQDTAGVAGEVGGRNAIILTGAGLPAATGVRIRLVAVYEWMPTPVGNGFIMSEAAPVDTSTTTASLLAKMREALGSWEFPSADHVTLANRFIEVLGAGTVAYASTKLARLTAG